MGGEQDLLVGSRQKRTAEREAHASRSACHVSGTVYCLANSNCTVPIVAFVQKTASQIKSQLLRLEKRQKRRPSAHRANQIEKVRRQLFNKSTAKTLDTPPQLTLAVPTELELDSPLNLTPQSNKREALFAAKATTAGWADETSTGRSVLRPTAVRQRLELRADPSVLLHRSDSAHPRAARTAGVVEESSAPWQSILHPDG